MVEEPASKNSMRLMLATCNLAAARIKIIMVIVLEIIIIIIRIIMIIIIIRYSFRQKLRPWLVGSETTGQIFACVCRGLHGERCPSSHFWLTGATLSEQSTIFHRDPTLFWAFHLMLPDIAMRIPLRPVGLSMINQPQKQNSWALTSS